MPPKGHYLNSNALKINVFMRSKQTFLYRLKSTSNGSSALRNTVIHLKYIYINLFKIESINDK